MSRLIRKHEHILTALKLSQRPVASVFNEVDFVHNALPEVRESEIFLAAEIFGKVLEAPLIINAITGGGSVSRKINEDLAVSARETGIAMAVGSQTVAFENRQYEESFKVVRKAYPQGVILANVGANVSSDAAAAAVEMLNANALQVHLNVPQETTMKEGDRDFRGWISNIGNILKKVEVPVIAKEVGFGMSMEVVRRLQEVGVHHFDIGGRGGTNFIAIEGFRSTGRAGCLESWGIPTAVSLVEAASSGLATTIFATGGIRNGLDVAKAMALGATAAGVAGVVLRVLCEKKVEGLIAGLENIKNDLKKVMQMLGVTRPSGLQRVPVVITGKTREWLVERGIDTTAYARRGWDRP